MAGQGGKELDEGFDRLEDELPPDRVSRAALAGAAPAPVAPGRWQRAWAGAASRVPRWPPDVAVSARARFR
jgi:hypothetical protein